MEPLDKLRVPLIFNLRRDPFERAQHNSNTYYDWMMSHAFMLYEMQAVVAEQIENFVKFPPRQKPASFNLDEVMRQVTGPPPVAPDTIADVERGCGCRRREGASLLRAASVSAARRRPGRLSPRSGRTGERRRADSSSVLAGARPTGEDHSDPDRRAAGPRRPPSTRCAGRAARVTGIDFSATSVRHTEELKQRYDLRNLEVHQLAVERVARAGRDVRSDRLHRRPASSRRSRCRAGGAARRARARRRDAPHGLRALRADRHLHASGALPAARHSGHADGDIGDLVAALGGAAARASAGAAAARRAGLSGRGGARRCAAAPAGPRLLGAAAVRAARHGPG